MIIKPLLRAAVLALALLPCACASNHAAPPPTATASAPSAPVARAPEPVMGAAPAPVASAYIDPASVDLAALLPQPPKDDSPLTKAEVNTVLAIQADASPATIARGKSEDTVSVWAFADVLGPGFNDKALPATSAFFKQATTEAAAVSNRGKAVFSRSRPPLVDARIKAFVDVPKSASYPSGHSTRALLWATILSDLLPAKAEAIMARGRAIGTDRIAMGVHFPSDVTAGFLLGNEIAQRVLASPGAKDDLARARAELEKAGLNR